MMRTERRFICTALAILICCFSYVTAFYNTLGSGKTPSTVLLRAMKNDINIPGQTDSTVNSFAGQERNSVQAAARFFTIATPLVLSAYPAALFGTPSVAVADAGRDAFVDALATIIAVKRIFEPTKKMVFDQAYDKARTNIKYCLNQLQLQKKVTVLVRNSIDFCDDMELVEAAQEAGNRLTNTAIQFDSSIYTCVFIPTDDMSIPPNAEKYRKDAFNFYDAFNQDCDILLAVASEAEKSAAESAAAALIKAAPTVLGV